MRTSFEQALRRLSELPGTESWYAVSTVWLCATFLLIALAWEDWQLATPTRSSGETFPNAPQSVQFDDPNKVQFASGTPGQVDFVSSLPRLAEPDGTIRFTSRLAQDQDVNIAQVQSEAIATDPKKLGQTKFTLQLRGDYRNIKNVTIGLLAKFPGLTLQRITIHHRDPASGTVPERSNDEATVELIQFTRPAKSP